MCVCVSNLRLFQGFVTWLVYLGGGAVVPIVIVWDIFEIVALFFFDDMVT